MANGVGFPTGLSRRLTERLRRAGRVRTRLAAPFRLDVVNAGTLYAIVTAPKPLARDNRSPMTGTRFLLTVVGITLIGCGDPSSRTAGREAAVPVVENGRIDVESAVSLRLTSDPVLHIGSAESAVAPVLHRVRGAVRLRSGGVAVANGGTNQVLVYDADGRLGAIVGRTGGGPREFKVLEGIWPYRGDSLVAWDRSLRRATVLSPAGAYVRSVRMAGLDVEAGMVGPLPDGSLLLADQTLIAVEAGPREQHSTLLRFDPDGAFVDSVGRFPSERTVPIPWYGGAVLWAHPLFSPQTRFLTTRDGFLVGTGADPELELYRPDGQTARVIRWAVGDRSVTRAHLRSYRLRHLDLAETPEEERRRRRFLDAVPASEEFPAYRSVRAAPNGELWVERYPRPGEENRNEWWIFDGTGRWSGVIRLPDRLDVLEATREYVLGHYRDHLGVEYVQLYQTEQMGTAGATQPTKLSEHRRGNQR